MIVIYYENFSHPLPPESFEKYLNMIPDEFSVRIKSFRKWQDAHTCLFGKLLLLKGLNHFNVGNSLNDIKYNRYGRPYFDQGPIDFNISHSGSSVVCAVSDEGTIGVDIEEIHAIEIGDFHKQFRPEEWAKIMSSDDKHTQFYAYWTKKEAAIKADGRGLSIPLMKVWIDGDVVHVEENTYKLHELLLTSGAKCHLASEKEITYIHMQLHSFG
jgi:4'-phosphopantetheinyl transferase